MRILRLFCAVALSSGLAGSLAAVAQEPPKGGAFGGPGTGGGGFGAAFGDPNVVDGKRLHFGGTSQVKIQFQPDAVLTTQMIGDLLFTERVWHAAVLDIGGKLNPQDKNGPPILIVDGDVVQISAVWGGSSLTTYQPIPNGVIFVEMGAHVTRTKSDLEKLGEGSAKAKYEPIAKKFSAALRKRLEKELTAITRRQFGREIERQKKSVEQELALAEEASQRVTEKREELRRLESGVPKQVLAESVSSLQKQHQQLELDLAGMKGRAEALQVEVAKTAKRLDKDPADDDVLRNLMRVIDLRKQQLAAARQLHATGAAGGEVPNVLKAEEQVTLAQVEFAQAKRAQTRPAADQLEKLNSDLAQLAISKAEAESKLDYVKNQLELYSELLRRETQTIQPARDKLAIEVEAAQTMLTEANRRLVELRRMEASFRPASVEVFSVEEELSLEPKSEATSVSEPAKKP
jgi:hypothetical protein